MSSTNPRRSRARRSSSIKGPPRRAARPRAHALWKISITTSAAAENAVAELLEQVFGEPTVSYLDADSSLCTITAYLSERPDWSRANRAVLKAALAGLRSRGLSIGPARCTLAKVPAQDWAESWKRHFRPLEIGAALLLKPTWSRRRPRRGQAVVRLDPGLSFGTGHHPTTAFCLEQIAARRASGKAHAFLDIGTGSGVLAIVAARLGYAPVHAFDLDADAVRIARENAHRNRVAAKVRFFKQDLARLPIRTARAYSLVCANLVAPLLLAQRRRILARLRSDGVLVLAGVLKREFQRVQRAYEAAGVRLIASRSDKEWRSGAFAHIAR